VPWVISFSPSVATIWSMFGFSPTMSCRSICRPADQALLVQRRIVGAVQFLQLIFQVGEARLEAQAEPVQDGEVGLVDAVHVAGDRGRHDVGRVAIPDVEHVVASYSCAPIR
jgi:hypothetical protein